MVRDVRKEFDRWLGRQKDMDQDIKSALLNPLKPTITKFVAMHASTYDHNYVLNTVPDELQAEAYFRVSMMHKAVMEQFKAYVSDMRVYSVFGSADDRATIQKMLLEFVEQIDRMPVVQE